jgi:hypothetical protein
MSSYSISKLEKEEKEKKKEGTATGVPARNSPWVEDATRGHW